MITEIAEGIYWAGITDWDIRKFHGHELSTHRGTTYNSYLILDEKVILVDTVPEEFQEILIENISKVVDPSLINYVIVNHAEVDHSGSLSHVLEKAPNAVVVVSKRGEESVFGHFHQNWKFHKVMTGESIHTGLNDLVFVEAPMLHWPDSMFTYLTGRNILFSNDAFGQHFATAFRYNDQVNVKELHDEALKYYANILTPFSEQVKSKIEELKSMNLQIDMIAPSHGVIWRENPFQIVEKYYEWAHQNPENRAIIVYDTMWKATGIMAEAIGEGLAETDTDYKILHAALTDRNDLLVEIFKSAAVIVGSSTLNNGVLPTIAPVLEDLKGLKFKNKIGAAFGSYGWSGEAVSCIEENLSRSKIEIAHESVSCKWRPTDEDIEKCHQLGRETGKRISESELIYR